MAVSSSVTLPAQPTAGESVYRPLGGDGWAAPHSLVTCHVSLAGDASGGNSDIQITPDQRFGSIFALLNTNTEGASAAIECIWELGDNSIQDPAAIGFVNAAPVDSLNGANHCSWDPPPLWNPKRVVNTIPNTNGDTHHLRVWIYQFNIRAAEVVPMFQLLANLPRSGLVHPVGL